MKTIVALLTTAVFVGFGSAALAQETKINDGNNPAPNYSPMSPAGNTDMPSKINDGNNPAPNYGANATAAPAPVPANKSTAKYTTRSHAHHKKPNS